MTHPPALSLELKAERLCGRLQEQRLLIAQQLGPRSAVRTGYPRSRTMRLLTQRPELVLRVLGLVAGLFRSR